MTRVLVVALALLACPNTMGPGDGGGPPPAGTVPPVDVSQFTGLDPDGGVQFMVEINKARLGESADLDGDGVNELTVYRTPEGVVVTTHETGYPVPAFVREQLPDGRVRTRYWFANYGQPVEIDEQQSDGSRQVLFDDTLDSRFDRRLTERHLDATTIEGLEEVDGGAGWVERARWTRPASMDQGGASCDGVGNFPVDPSRTIDGQAQTSSPFFAGDSEVVCLKKHRDQLSKAIDCARKRLSCLDEMNPVVASRVRSALTSQELAYGCANPCANKHATTARLPGKPWRTNFTRDQLDKLDEDQTCTIVMHEWMHFAQVPMDNHHDDGFDQVYACARFCTHCTSIGPAMPPPTANEDCARCAFNDAARRKCGVKRELMSGSCPSYSICHGTIGTNRTCDACENLQEKDCLGAPIGVPYFNCCQTCPADAQRMNDKPCPGPLMSSDTWMTPPMQCKK